jgi:hypothetical protein
MHNFTLAGSFDTGLTTTTLIFSNLVNNKCHLNAAMIAAIFLENKKPA